MLKHKGLLALAAVAVAGLICMVQAAAPPGGNTGRTDRGNRGGFDPNEFRQRMEDRMKESLGVSAEEWKALQPRIEKVTALSRELRGGGMFGRGGMRGGPGGAPAPEPTTEVGKASQSLSKLLENKEARPEDIKAALEALRDAKAKVRAELEKAQKELREVLTIRQEAQLVVTGTLE